jgi:hypothetical protein
MSIQRLICFAFTLTGAFSTLYAGDGVILIDQNRALAGNVTPVDAPGFPVTITQPGSYRLSGNLTAGANVSGIEILASNVTLDLNGFTISGPPRSPVAFALFSLELLPRSVTHTGP